MDLPDKNLDAWIEIAIQPEVCITAQQKQLAWERLSQRAMQQTMLPTVFRLEERTSVMRVRAAGEVMWRWFSTFLTEEEPYERARRNRHMMRYQSFSANSEFGIQFLVPMRLSV